MKTTINNNLRIYQIVTSTGKQIFCNIEEMNDSVKYLDTHAGYFKIYHFGNNKAQRVSKKDLKAFFEGSQLIRFSIFQIRTWTLQGNLYKSSNR